MAQADANEMNDSSANVSDMTCEEFAQEVEKRLKSDRYTKFIIEEEISGEAFQAGGDPLIQSFTDLDSEKKIKQGHIVILQKYRQSSFGTQGSTDERVSGEADKGPADCLSRELVAVEEGGASEGAKEKGTEKRKAAQAMNEPATAQNLFATLWQSHKWKHVMGGNGVRRMQAMHADLSNRMHVDLGLEDYAQGGSKENENLPDEQQERLASIHLKKNGKDREWRDRIYDAIMGEGESGGMLTTLDGKVFRWPKGTFNRTFNSILDTMRKKLLKAEKYKRNQQKKLQKYHANKKLKGRSEARAALPQGSADGSHGEAPAQESGTPSSDPPRSPRGEPRASNANPAKETGADGPPGILDDPEEARTAIAAENQPADHPTPAPTSATKKAPPKPKSGCAIQGCASAAKMQDTEFCRDCSQPVHKECARVQLKKLYGVPRYDGDVLYCSEHIAKFNFRKGLGGKCALPSCDKAGNMTQHCCKTCQAPMHNLCYQNFLRQEYGKEDFDGGAYFCKVHAGALGLKKLTTASTSSTGVCAETLLGLSEQEVDLPVKKRSGESGDAGEEQQKKRKGGGDSMKQDKKKRKTGPEAEKTDGDDGKDSKTEEGGKSGKDGKGGKGDKPRKELTSAEPETDPPTEPVEDSAAPRQSMRKAVKYTLIWNASHVVPDKSVGKKGEKRANGGEKAKKGKKKRKTAAPEDSEDEMSLEGSAAESSEEESDAEAQTDLPKNGDFEDRDEKLSPAMRNKYEMICMKGLDVTQSYKLSTDTLVSAIKKLQIPHVSKNRELPDLPLEYLLKLLAEGLIDKKKIVIKGNRWREDATELRKSDISRPFC
ncbi:hypothetical protein KFL_003620090 [Klebsormidium nitens]|uniref:Uncharacterized protein n=1 Tax=Klebsormidium nitens TaxID=105231 RepID=A0A1Y1IFR3_KLENI|nr:hypothetical protein KFL_003620090 [Klebsormidium nitens]|eukprot:GAQ87577.1 hypothetical protein KFL_003620090 [Klebsormidium nitens]